MASILVLGATGYVGSKLIPELLKRGHSVRCLVRNKHKLPDNIRGKIHAVEGDVLKPETLEGVFEGIDYIYYLVHSMGAGESKFEDLDELAAGNTVAEAERSGVKRIIYLGGLGRRDVEQSAHLRSRHSVGDRLRSGEVPVTEFRAAVILGSGSLSFEMIHHLVNRLPVMICPRWVMTDTQPIAIDDVARYLVESIDKKEAEGRIIDIGGPEVMTYRDMMLRFAKALGLKRFLIQVPVLTPRLSSYWVDLVTPIPSHLARALIEGVRYETVCENDDALKIFKFKPKSYEDAVYKAFTGKYPLESDALGHDITPEIKRELIEPSHYLFDSREIVAGVPADRVFGIIEKIGGDNGWYFADTLWRLRGYIDKLMGGIGFRKGRSDPEKLNVGDKVDFWRVEEAIPNSKAVFTAELNLWGRAWLEFDLRPVGENLCRVRQRALYYPKGLFGFVYWYGIYPVHLVVFKGMLRAIVSKAVGK